MSTTDNSCLRSVLLAAAGVIRQFGLARGTRHAGFCDHRGNKVGSHCLLGAIDVVTTENYRRGFRPPCVEAHTAHTLNVAAQKAVAALIPAPPPDAEDKFNFGSPSDIAAQASAKCAWWNNMVAKDANEVAAKLEEAAEVLSIERNV